ncbi:MAG: hypothetical protein HY305_02745, partial [Sphingobacteriales bacterium]|nr:hypothetical protein [Sphingobacteriales bacterium]
MNEKHNTTVLKKKAGMEIAANVVLRYSVGTNEKAILKGPVMNRVQDTGPYVEFPQTVHIDFYDVHDSLEDKL